MRKACEWCRGRLRSFVIYGYAQTFGWALFSWIQTVLIQTEIIHQWRRKIPLAAHMDSVRQLRVQYSGHTSSQTRLPPLFLHKLDIPSTFLLTAQINICLPRSPKTRYGQISAGSATFHCNRAVLFVQTPHVLHDDSWMKWFIFPHLRFPFSFSSEILCPALQLLQGCRPRSHQRSQLKTLHCWERKKKENHT